MKRLLIGLSLVLAVSIPASASGAGGTYTVVQCDPLNRTSGEATLEPTVFYAVRSFCGESDHGFAIRVENVLKSRPGKEGAVYWQAPAGTSIVEVTAEVQLRNENGHRARAFIADGAGREVRRIANGSASATDWTSIHYKSVGTGHERFELTLSCEDDHACPESSKAKAFVRNVRMKVEDEKGPVLDRVGGSLFGGGWLRADKALELSASDRESGLTGVSASVGPTTIRNFPGSCPGSLGIPSYASVFAVCDRELFGAAAVNTAVPPLVDGVNQVEVCVSDFANDSACIQKNVRIDNSPPSLSFEAEQPVSDPEFVRANAVDEVSGLSTSEILFRPLGADVWQSMPTVVEGDHVQGRVDSSAFPPGPYEFLVRATDVAGNVAESVLTSDGQPKILNFPLRSGVQLTAQMEPGGTKRRTVSYGRTGHVAGKLRTADGKPLAHRDVAVVEHFGEGALISKRKRTVTTDGHGNWSERVPAGPSRRVTASFDGDERFLAVEKQAGRLFVRSKALFKTSRRSLQEGKRVVFSGKVGHLGAHIPPGGKLVEVQVRERPGLWNTVREAFYTNGAGRYKIGYRFGRFSIRDARFRFRVKVTREQGWPYKAPVHSRQRTVVVRAHK
ncbi:hypothetical protein BH10ACT11_BH10ACT11_14220 [soil metagenome]